MNLSKRCCRSTSFMYQFKTSFYPKYKKNLTWPDRKSDYMKFLSGCCKTLRIGQDPDLNVCLGPVDGDEH